MLHRGDHLPHFEVTDTAGRRVRYASIWQARPLVLVCLPPDAPAFAGYAARLGARFAEFADAVACVVTREPVQGIDAPAVVADQWGEVIHVAAATDPAGLPVPEELADWMQFVLHRCPECEGEAL